MFTLKTMAARLSNHPTVLRSAVLCAAFLVILSTVRFSRKDPAYATAFSSHAPTVHQASEQLRPTISSRQRMLEITNANTDLVYLPTPNILFMTMAKGGTTSTWNWLYRGVTGRDKFDRNHCQSYVQDVRSHCWGEEAVHLFRLPEDEQWRILTSPETLRVAIQRNPFERIISSFKSKFTCENDVYGTDLRNRATMVPQLRRQSGLPIGAGCMNISEFAEALDVAQRNAGTPGYIRSLRNMDVHIRPQEFYFDEIDYDMVLDVKDLSSIDYLEPIIKRLNYTDLVKNGIERRHASKGSQLMIPEDAAAKIYMFALQSKPGKSKYITTTQ